MGVTCTKPKAGLPDPSSDPELSDHRLITETFNLKVSAYKFRMQTVPVSVHYCFLTLSVGYSKVSPDCARRGKVVSVHITLGRGWMQPLRLPTLRCADPRQVWSLGCSRQGEDSSGRLLFLLLAGQQGFGWMGKHSCNPREAQPAAAFCFGFAGRATLRLTAWEGPMSLRSHGRTFPFSVSLPYDMWPAMSPWYTPAHSTTPRFQALSSWKILKSGMKRGVGSVWDYDVTWQPWEGWVISLLPPLPGL